MARTVRNEKLDSRSARAKLAAKKSGYWVPLSPGCAIGYRKGPKGGVWLAKLVQGSARKETTLGPADDVLDPDGKLSLSYAQAQEAARAWFPRALKEEGRGSEPRVPYTVTVATAEYLTAYEQRGGKALRSTELPIDAFILPRFGNVLVSDLTSADIRAWHADLASKPARLRTRMATKQNAREHDVNDQEATRRRRATANRILTVLKAALNHAFREGKIASDEAWRRVKPFRDADVAKVRYLNATEVQALVKVTDPEFRPLVQAALLTGCRYGELAGFRVADFDLEAGTITVRGDRSKGGKTRHVVLNDDGIALFDSHAADKVSSALIFPRPDGVAWGTSHQHRRLREACAAAKIEPAISFHVLRHTYATMLLRAGAPLPVIAANLGHADTRMTEKHYAHLVPGYVASAIRAAMPKLGILDSERACP